MRITKTRTTIAALALGAVAVTGAFATGVAGAQGTSTHTSAAKQFRSSLSSDQKSCLASNGVVRPGRGSTLAEKQAFLTSLETAAGTCNITLPAKIERRIDWITSLDQTQVDCLKANVTRPTEHTPDARQQFRTELRNAVTTCGITRPAA